LDVRTITDTFNIDKEIIKVKTVVKNIRITDTITKVVTDNSRIDLLQRQLNISIDKGLELSRKNDSLKTAANDLKKDRNKWRLYFFLLAIAFIVYLLRKPLLQLIKLIKFPL
jgi:hypothetical protein